MSGEGVTSDGIQCLVAAARAGLGGHGRPPCRAELWTALDCSQEWPPWETPPFLSSPSSLSSTAMEGVSVSFKEISVSFRMIWRLCAPPYFLWSHDCWTGCMTRWAQKGVSGQAEGLDFYLYGWGLEPQADFPQALEVASSLVFPDSHPSFSCFLPVVQNSHLGDFFFRNYYFHNMSRSQ